ncbi:MAG: UPF0182 family protein [Coriobacteriia bacterium]|nr:UPF0182 family protein [Coriobacteriia bacterium]
MAARIRRPNTITIVIIVLVALAALSGIAAEFYTDALWYEDLGQSVVFWRGLGWSWGIGALSALLYFGVVFANIRIARSLSPVGPRRVPLTPGLQFEETIDAIRRALGRSTGPAAVGVAAVAAIMAGIAAAGSWETIALAFNGGSFGVADAHFGRDIGFFFFTLPAFRFVQQWLTGALLVALLIVAAVYLLAGSIRPWDRWRGFDSHVKAHLSVVGGLIIVVQAFGYWLDIFELDYSPRGQVLGASFTDINAQIPAYSILIVIALLSGIALLVNIRFRGWRLPVIALGAWAAAAVLVGGVYPSVVQQFRVAPNEVEAESPYIARNIEVTREAYDLDDIEVRAFPADESLTAADLPENARTIENIRLWDPSVVPDTYRQLQGMRPYYNFTDVDIDRYTLDGEQQQVLISARELDVSRLASQAQTWVNQHLVYTHGYGIVISPVNESSGQGYPHFLMKDIPPVTSSDLVLDQPALYFGEAAANYVIAGTELAEFDYPVGDSNAEITYTGEGGIEVGGFVRRAAFATRFSAPQILFSNYITADSKLLFRRSISERVTALAPWLYQDSDPYPVVTDGRIVWVMDCFTTSDRYPYSERYGGINYIRNSVKVTVDAYDGTTTLYAYDPTDPLLEAWSRVYPGLLTDVAEMPEGIVEHLRYPADLFSLQAEVYKTYHMEDPKVFYNKEDQWALPGEGSDELGTAMDPFYVLMELPEETVEDFMLMMPFTPRTKANMIGWMAAKSDPGSYGERVVYTLPKQRLVLGPEQVSARVNQDPVISQQLTLWTQRESGVRWGNLLVIPMDDSIVYVQPLYLQSEQTSMPQLTRVVVAYGDKIAMEPTLDAALLAVFGEQERPGDGSGPADVAAARDLYESAVAAQREGDWEAYGRYISELGDVLVILTGDETTVTPTP